MSGNGSVGSTARQPEAATAAAGAGRGDYTAVARIGALESAAIGITSLEPLSGVVCSIAGEMPLSSAGPLTTARKIPSGMQEAFFRLPELREYGYLWKISRAMEPKRTTAPSHGYQ